MKTRLVLPVRSLGIRVKNRICIFRQPQLKECTIILVNQILPFFVRRISKKERIVRLRNTRMDSSTSHGNVDDSMRFPREKIFLWSRLVLVFPGILQNVQDVFQLVDHHIPGYPVPRYSPDILRVRLRPDRLFMHPVAAFFLGLVLRSFRPSRYSSGILARVRNRFTFSGGTNKSNAVFHSGSPTTSQA